MASSTVSGPIKAVQATGELTSLDSISRGCGSLTIENMKSHRDCLPIVAGWHQQYWRGQGRHCSLQERLQKLRAHLSTRCLPATWLAFSDKTLIGSISLVDYGFFNHGLQNGDKQKNHAQNRDSEYNHTNQVVKVINSPSVWVANFFVRADRRGRGVGTRLLEFVEERARLMDIEQLFLFTPDIKQFYLDRQWRWLRRRRVQRQWVDVLCFSLV